MPRIDEFDRTRPDCAFEMPSGWGSRVYAVADNGRRVRCRHLGGMSRTREVVGEDASRGGIDRHTGVNSHCVRPESPVDADLNEHETVCLECRSNAIETIDDRLDRGCSVCDGGPFATGETGTIA